MWSDLLGGLPVGQIGPTALLAIVVLLILTGRLIPRQALLDAREDVEKLREDADKIRVDRDKWQTVATDWQKAYLEVGMGFERQLAQGEAVLHALEEIQDAMTRPPGGRS